MKITNPEEFAATWALAKEIDDFIAQSDDTSNHLLERAGLSIQPGASGLTTAHRVSSRLHAQKAAYIRVTQLSTQGGTEELSDLPRSMTDIMVARDIDESQDDHYPLASPGNRGSMSLGELDRWCRELGVVLHVTLTFREADQVAQIQAQTSRVRKTRR